jgi:phospholipase/carboxylesterase
LKLPFRQTDQFPPLEMLERLFHRCVGIPGVRIRQSRCAPEQSRALYLDGPAPAGPPEAFIDGREFCHLHAPPEGSVHLTLPSSVVEQLVALGWILRHPIHELGVFQNLVMAYGPRDAIEVDVVFNLVEHSCRFARGLGVPVGPLTHALV